MASKPKMALGATGAPDIVVGARPAGPTGATGGATGGTGATGASPASTGATGATGAVDAIASALAAADATYATQLAALAAPDPEAKKLRDMARQLLAQADALDGPDRIQARQMLSQHNQARQGRGGQRPHQRLAPNSPAK